MNIGLTLLALAITPHGSPALKLSALKLSAMKPSALKLSEMIPADLRCEGLRNPIGVDFGRSFLTGSQKTPPVLSWALKTSDLSARDLVQHSFQILVASDPRLLSPQRADLWQHVAVSSESHIAYRGHTLRSSQKAYWKVRVWDQSGHRSEWSKPASFVMGVVKSGDWRAKWISGPAKPATLLMRKEFTVARTPARAILHVCGLGQYEFYLNGRKVGDDLLAPGWTNYKRTCLYNSFDITDLIRKGQNAAGLILGNGMYHVPEGRYTKFTGSFGPLKAIAQIEIRYSDGRSQYLCSDGSWRVAPGPITFSSIYGGEDYDARLEPQGWKTAHFDDGAWASASIVDGPGGALLGVCHSASPIRRFETLKPVKVTMIRPGVEVYDFGQNVSMEPLLRVRGAAGTVIKMTPAELIHPDGTVDRSSCGGGEAYWQYTLKGGSETYFPRFFYHGARYLQVERTAGEGQELPKVTSLESCVVHSDSERIGQFACSNELFNRIYSLVVWAQESNLVSVLTDCPHRERLGWLEQDHLNGPALRYNFDLRPLFAKTITDMADSQLPNGFVPNIAPEFVVFGENDQDTSNPFRNSAEWGASFSQVPWQQYLFTGDASLMERNYEALKNYVAFLDSQAKNSILDFGLGDWYDIGPRSPGFSQLTPRALTATAFYFADVEILAKTALLLGKPSEASTYQQQAAAIKTAFNAKFFNPQTARYGTGSQCANSVALVMNLVPEDKRKAVLDVIVKDVQTRGLTAGDVGYRYLLRALADGGRSDVIYSMNNRSDKPGYGYQLAHGATSLTEAWDARSSSSQNHFMLGQIVEWFFSDLAGIQADPAKPGFRHFLIKPAVIEDLTWARGSYRSPQGLITTEWHKHGKQFTLHVVVPPNCTASVIVPCAAGSQVTEAGGALAAETAGLSHHPTASKTFTIGSGSYTFHSKLS